MSYATLPGSARGPALLVAATAPYAADPDFRRVQTLGFRALELGVSFRTVGATKCQLVDVELDESGCVKRLTQLTPPIPFSSMEALLDQLAAAGRSPKATRDHLFRVDVMEVLS